jgi:hypothetical protein
MTTEHDNAREKQLAAAEQRLASVERDIANLAGAVDRLYEMIREQGQLIGEYVTKQLVAAGQGEGDTGEVSPEDALFTFVCRRKFDTLEKELARLREILTASGPIRRAG